MMRESFSQRLIIVDNKLFMRSNVSRFIIISIEIYWYHEIKNTPYTIGVFFKSTSSVYLQMSHSE